MGGTKVSIGGPTGAFIVILYGIAAKYGFDNLVICTILAEEKRAPGLEDRVTHSSVQKALGPCLAGSKSIGTNGSRVLSFANRPRMAATLSRSESHLFPPTGLLPGGSEFQRRGRCSVR